MTAKLQSNEEVVIRTTQKRSERYERERVDASERHKRKLEQMRESHDYEELGSQDRPRRGVVGVTDVINPLHDPESTRP